VAVNISSKAHEFVFGAAAHKCPALTSLALPCRNYCSSGAPWFVMQYAYRIDNGGSADFNTLQFH